MNPGGFSQGTIERFRHLAENAWDVLYRYRLTPTPGFDYLSPAVIRFDGYSPEEHAADPELVWRIVHPDDRPLLQAMLEKSSDAASELVTVRLRHKDGRTVWTEHRIIPVRDERGTVVAVEGIMRDVTERVVAYQTLEGRVEERTQELERRRKVMNWICILSSRVRLA